MSSVDVQFCRSLLGLVMPEVRKHTTAEQRKTAWTYSYGRDHWEFHGPDGFYWHGSAGNAYDARYHGWSTWLTKMGHDKPTEDVT